MFGGMVIFSSNIDTPVDWSLFYNTVAKCYNIKKLYNRLLSIDKSVLLVFALPFG